MNNKAIICIISVLSIILSVALIACHEVQAADIKVNESEARKVIIDTDTGADDASAIIRAAVKRSGPMNSSIP